MQPQSIAQQHEVVVLVPEKIQQFAKYIERYINDLRNFHKNVLKRLSHYQYPFDSYMKSWQTLEKSVKRKIEHFKKDPQFPFIISDILNWMMPNCCTSYNDINAYINKYLSKPDSVQRDQEIRPIWNQFIESSQEKHQIQEINEKSILTYPLAFINKFVKLQIFFQYIDESIEKLEKLLVEEQKQEIRAMVRMNIGRLKSQRQNLDNSIKLFKKNIDLLNSNDEGINKDNHILQYRIIMNQFPQVKKNNKYLVKFGCRLKFIVKLKARAKKVQKKLQDRKMYILQIIDGQQKYIKGLQDYIEYIKKPIQQLNIYSKEELSKLFSTIEEIKQFHILFVDQLRKHYANYHKYQIYGDIMKKNIPGFKLYLDYIYNAEAAQKLLIHLEATNEKVAQICKRYLSEKEKIAANELMQPTFKIARYQMLMQDIIKKTNPDHPDYAKMSDAKDFFKKNLTEVNDAVDKIMRRNRMNQLQQQFGTEYSPIYVPGREYLNEFVLSYIKGDMLVSIILLIFSDILIILQEQTRKIMKWIKIDDKFFVRREEDNKFYRNMLTIHAEGLLTFTAGSQDKNFNRIEEVYHLLKKLTKQGGQLVFVSVLGTEEIGSTSFSKHTEYIVEVKYLELKKLLHIRFSEMNQIVQQMQNNYKDKLKITQEETLKKNWFNNHKSKTIEDRKRTIAQILQKLFNHDLIKRDPKFFLTYLGLPTNFYSIARQSMQKRMSISSQNESLSSSKLSKKQEREAFTILCGTQLKLGRDLFHDNDENIKKMKDQSQKLQIYVTTMVGQPVMIKISTLDTVEDVCNKVSRLIGLRSNRDFRLFHEIGKKELRVLEHEQVMTKLFTFPKKQQEILIVGFIESVASSVKKIISPDNFPTLIFKKYYYLPFQIEQAEVKKDLIRLKLIVYQIFAEIKEMKYQLIFDQYLLFVAMLIYIQADGQIDQGFQIDSKDVHRIVPDTVFKLKNYSEAEWVVKVRPHLLRLKTQIDSVRTFNLQQINLKKIKVDSVSKTALFTGSRHLCSQIVLNKIKTNPIFGSNIFYTQPHSSTYDSLIKKGLKMAYNMWLAVKVESLNLLTPSSKQCVLELNYKDIQKIQVFSQSIVFKMDDYIGEEYRLNTYQSFQISQLVKYNKALNEILSEIKTNSELSARIKIYRDDLLQYRNTDDQGNESLSMIK